MNKKVLFVSSLALTSLMVLPLLNSHHMFAKAEEITTRHVDFFSNYLRQDAELSNGTKFIGDSLLYKTADVADGALVEKPEDPKRRNYEFKGWFLEKDNPTTEWDFSKDTVKKDMRLFAKWDIAEESDIVEPSYTPPSTVLSEEADHDYEIKTIMNFKINGNQVKLPTAALTKLGGHSDNVLPYMEYKAKVSKPITAIYEDNKIVVKNSNEETLQEINVVNDSTRYTVSNSDYETKAKKYEAKALEEESYHVMLAGSSSIEFWETSKEDMNPIVTYNHGIGGTTVEEWTTKLNQRLVYPYKPKMVVYYVGINNVINSKEEATVISNRLTSLLDETHASLPDTQVQYILMNQLPSYSSYKSVINTVNNTVKEYQKNNSDWLTWIDPGKALLKANGEPNAAYFRVDGLHLSRYGYTIWGNIIKESIIAGLEKMAG